MRNAGLIILSLAAAATPALAAGPAKQQGFNWTVELTAGAAEAGGKNQTYAFVEISMPAGWKTYWRNPGDAGGLPPGFQWPRSENLAEARVLYPAPQRLSDPAGDNIGYKERAIFPVALAAQDPAKPVKLALDMNFGICKDICVPAEAALEIEIPADVGPAAADGLAALARIPKTAGDKSAADPEFVSATIDAAVTKPKLIVTAKFPAGPAGADAFLEVPGGLYVPMFARTSKDGDSIQVFETELGSLVEPKDLKGKALMVTLVSENGQSEATFTLD